MGTAQQVEAAHLMAEVCSRFDVPLAAAALQFAASSPQVHSVLVGASRPERVDELVALATLDLPAGLMDELERLAPPRSAWIPD